MYRDIFAPTNDRRGLGQVLYLRSNCERFVQVVCKTSPLGFLPKHPIGQVGSPYCRMPCNRSLNLAKIDSTDSGWLASTEDIFN
jgi:hypothetical protein